MPRAQGKARRKVETPPREAKRELEGLPQDGTHRCRPSPQINLKKGEHKPCWPSREPSREDVLPTRQGPSPWDPGGPAGERTTESRGPVEANNKNDAAAIGACKPNKKALAMQTSSQSISTNPSSQTRILDLSTIVSLHHPELLPSRSLFVFHFEAHREGTTSSWESRRRCNKALRDSFFFFWKALYLW